MFPERKKKKKLLCWSLKLQNNDIREEIFSVLLIIRNLHWIRTRMKVLLIHTVSKVIRLSQLRSQEHQNSSVRHYCILRARTLRPIIKLGVKLLNLIVCLVFLFLFFWVDHQLLNWHLVILVDLHIYSCEWLINY